MFVVNDWEVILDGLKASTGTGAVYLYFVAFWICTVVVMMNVLVAFFVDTYSMHREKRLIMQRQDLEARGKLSRSTDPEISLHGIDDWASVLSESGVDFSDFVISRRLQGFDTMDDLYRRDVRRRFADTFDSVRPPAQPA